MHLTIVVSFFGRPVSFSKESSKSHSWIKHPLTTWQRLTCALELCCHFHVLLSRSSVTRSHVSHGKAKHVIHCDSSIKATSRFSSGKMCRRNLCRSWACVVHEDGRKAGLQPRRWLRSPEYQTTSGLSNMQRSCRLWPVMASRHSHPKPTQGPNKAEKSQGIAGSNPILCKKILFWMPQCESNYQHGGQSKPLYIILYINL